MDGCWEEYGGGDYITERGYIYIYIWERGEEIEGLKL